MAKKVTIYALVDPRDRSVRYVGQTVQPSVRLGQHLRKPINKRVARWLAELAEAGRKPRLKILQVVDAVESDVAEDRWLREHFATALNLGPAGTGRRFGEKTPVDRPVTYTVTIPSSHSQTIVATAGARRTTARAMIGEAIDEWCARLAVADHETARAMVGAAIAQWCARLASEPTSESQEAWNDR